MITALLDESLSQMTDPPTCTLSQTHEYYHLVNKKIKMAIAAVAPLALLATFYGDDVYNKYMSNSDQVKVEQKSDVNDKKISKVRLGAAMSSAMSKAVTDGSAAGVRASKEIAKAQAEAQAQAEAEAQAQAQVEAQAQAQVEAQAQAEAEAQAQAQVEAQAQAQVEAQAAQAQTQAPAANYSSYGSGTVVLSNGNTAGEVGTYAAQEIARRTGTDAGTWEHIIARESNGQVNAYNASGASGLFQTMPGWGSTATVEDQINSAINAYNAQGFSAWGY